MRALRNAIVRPAQEKLLNGLLIAESQRTHAFLRAERRIESTDQIDVPGGMPPQGVQLARSGIGKHCTHFSDFIFEPVLKDLSFVEETSQV